MNPAFIRSTEARELVEQLRLEAGIDCIKVSKPVADLMSYCEKHAHSDPCWWAFPPRRILSKTKDPA
ncbi:hypothetical protein ANANG_G00131850 [Anguilla anguilla]|uniref:Guanine nucleotide-binding protein subunit gamma n=1 Tax=Anguilla anguilla TaxID=7936 RepID=A0A9D3RYJ9_ANGAN|nr:hypothetical protein ANANG_G00131850 [Anguilla anguilla]